MGMNIVRFIVAGTVVVVVTELAQRSPRVGALVLTLPITSIIAFVAVWARLGNLRTVSGRARETLILVPLGLPFFVPLAFADRFGLGFWWAFILGIVLACVTIGGWMWLARAS